MDSINLKKNNSWQRNFKQLIVCKKKEWKESNFGKKLEAVFSAKRYNEYFPFSNYF